MLAVTGALALVLGAVVYDERQASHACDEYLAYILAGFIPTPNIGPWRTATEWEWRKLEWECVYTSTRTGRVHRIDIDDARSR